MRQIQGVGEGQNDSSFNYNLILYKLLHHILFFSALDGLRIYDP